MDIYEAIEKLRELGYEAKKFSGTHIEIRQVAGTHTLNMREVGDLLTSTVEHPARLIKYIDHPGCFHRFPQPDSEVDYAEN